MKKALVLLGCVFVYSALVTGLRMAGIQLGGIPTVVLAAVVVFIPARLIFRKKKAAAPTALREDEPVSPVTEEPPAPDEAEAHAVELPQEKERRTHRSLPVVAIVALCCVSCLAGLAIGARLHQSAIYDAGYDAGHADGKAEKNALYEEQLEYLLDRLNEDPRSSGGFSLDEYIQEREDAVARWNKAKAAGETTLPFEAWWAKEKEK